MTKANDNTVPDGYKRCPKCGDTKILGEFHKNKRMKDGLHYYCKSCSVILTSQWQRDNPEKVNSKNRKWKQEHPETERQYRSRNSEKLAKQKSEWQRNNPEKISVTIRRWRRNNPGKVNKLTQGRRARIKNLPSTYTLRHWQAACKYFNNSCAYCGKGNVKLCQEHVVPQSKGGGYTPDNIIPACKSCNSQKSDHEVFKWLIRKFGVTSAATILKNIEIYFEWIKQYE